MVYNLIMRSEANNQVYALSPELSFAFKGYVNEIEEEILGDNGDYQYLGDDWDVQFYGVIDGEVSGRLISVETLGWGIDGLQTLSDIALDSAYSDLRCSNLIEDYFEDVSEKELMRAKMQLDIK